MAAAATAYRTKWAWPCEQIGSALVRPLTGGIEALLVPTPAAVAVYNRLKLTGAGCVAILIPSRRRDQWLFLADANDQILCEVDLPYGVSHIRAPAVIPLPPTVTEAGSVRWLRAPDTADRWLPTSLALAAAARSAIAAPPLRLVSTVAPKRAGDMWWNHL